MPLACFLYPPRSAQMNIRAVDVARLFRKQKADDSNSVFQLAYISGRDSLGHCGQLFLWRAAGIDKTGGNSINRNSMGCDNAGQGAREDQQPCLGDIVRGQLGLGNQLVRVGHAEADDPPPLALDHPWSNRLAEIEKRVEIVVEHRAPTLNALLEKVDPVVRAGAVDQGIDPSPFFLHALNQLLSRFRVGYVALERYPLGALILHGIDYFRTDRKSVV